MFEVVFASLLTQDVNDMWMSADAALHSGKRSELIEKRSGANTLPSGAILFRSNVSRPAVPTEGPAGTWNMGSRADVA